MLIFQQISLMRKKKVKVSEKELKELGNLEDKKGDSKLND